MLDQLMYTQAAVQERRQEVERLLETSKWLKARKAAAQPKMVWYKRLWEPVWTLLQFARE